MLRGPGRAGRAGWWWLAAGALAGLACLSKYSALFLAPGVLLWLAPERPTAAARCARPGRGWRPLIARRRLRAQHRLERRPRLADLRQAVRPRRAAAGFAPRYLAKFLVDQFMLLNPLIVALRRARRWSGASPGRCWRSARRSRLYLADPQPARRGAGPVAVAALSDADGRRRGRGGGRDGLAGAAADGRRAGWRSRSSPARSRFALAPSDGRLPFHDPLGELPRLAGVLRCGRERRACGPARPGSARPPTASPPSSPPRRASTRPRREIYERERYTFETPAERADFSKPGLVVVPVRGAGARTLRLCFTDVQMLPEIDRGVGRGMTAYAVLRVAGAEARHRAHRLLPPAPDEVLNEPSPGELCAGRRAWNFPAKA